MRRAPSMTLRDYSRLRRGTAAALSRALRLSPCVVSNWISGRRQVPLARCLEIERLTRGVVRAEQLRPDVDWRRRTRMVPS